MSLSVREGSLRITVRDNGRGLDLAVPRQRTNADGLGNMRERLRRLDGDCELASQPGHGMTVAFVIPLGPKAELAGR